ncbi:MAG: hypothetical protein FJ098_16375, partial [Deltaproteobacteria bacterium]|nr:hypothetical protein [Deltaproteobacteria bacterium]
PPPPSDRMATCVAQTVAPGDIILFHVGPASTPVALSAVLAALAAEGYQFLTLEQILLYGTPAWDPLNVEAKHCDAWYR